VCVDDHRDGVLAEAKLSLRQGWKR